MVLNLILLFIIIFLLIILSMIWPPDSPWSPWWRTGNAKAREVLKLAKVTKNDLVYELGSGEGRVLIIAASELGARGVGIEIDPLRVFISRILIKLNNVSNKIKIIKGNFFDQDFSKADVLFVYLVPNALKKLKPKFIKELKKGTRIVSLKYQIDLPISAFDKTNDLYLYKM